jgi:hypothetical protein
MTNPYSTPAAPDWQQWQVTVPQTWSAPQLADGDAVHWGREAVVAGFVTAYSVVLGGIAGLVWPHLAPHIRLVDAINGSEAASKALLGDDMWLALLGIIAGVLAVAILALVARDAGHGPGGVVGLAVGGVLGSLAAAHVGHLVQQPHIVAALRSSFPGVTHSTITQLLGYFGFRVRARSVLVAWPIAAVAMQLLVLALRHLRAVGLAPSPPA